MFGRTLPTCEYVSSVTDLAHDSPEAEALEDDHRRLIRAWTEKLANRPGREGRLFRRALASGWC